MMHSFLKNPIVKTLGILVILYFALFHDKHHPDSLPNQLSAKKISKNLSEIKKQTQFISTKLEQQQDQVQNNPIDVETHNNPEKSVEQSR